MKGKKSRLIMESEGVYKIIEDDSDTDSVKISDYLKCIRDLENKK